MAIRAEEIREGLLSVSWTVQNLSYSTPSSQKEVPNLRKRIFKSCSLTCRLENNLLVLEMKTADPSDSLRGVVVTASYGSVKHNMTLNESTWKASWNWNFPTLYNGRGNCQYCGGGQKAITFEILIFLKPDTMISMKKGSKHVLEHLEKLWENKTISDVTFKCGDKLIKAHTLILASGSPVLAAMFQNDFKENQKRMVLIKDIEAKVFENFLRYIYVGECDLLEKGGNEVANLLVAADKYAVDSLKEECAIYLSQTLTVENASKYLVLAHLHNVHKLHESALDFMSKNAKAVCSRKDWMDVIKSYPELCFQATQLMVGL